VALPFRQTMILFVQIAMSELARVIRKPTRKICLWSKTNLIELKARMIEHKDSFMRQYLSRSVEVNYNDFKSFVDSVMDTCIRTKRTSSRFNMPWFNNTLKRMCRKNKGCLIGQKGPRVLNIGSSMSHSRETL